MEKRVYKCMKCGAWLEKEKAFCSKHGWRQGLKWTAIILGSLIAASAIGVFISYVIGPYGGVITILLFIPPTLLIRVAKNKFKERDYRYVKIEDENRTS